MPSEARCLCPQLKNLNTPIKVNENCSLIVSGMGASRAYDAANRLIDSGANHVISWGTAAALHNSLRPGDILLPEKIIDTQGVNHPLNNLSELQNLELDGTHNKKSVRIFHNDLAETNEFLDTPEAKEQLHQSTGAWAADMESAAIFRSATEHQISMNAVRVISDTAQQSIPATVKNHLNKFSQPLFPDFYLSLVLAPRDVIALIKLGLGFRKACQSLKMLSSQIKEGK